MQAGAVHQEPGRVLAGRAVDGHAIVVVVQAGDAGVAHDRAAGFTDPLGQPLTHLPVVDDSRLRYVDGPDACGVRLQFREPGLVD